MTTTFKEVATGIRTQLLASTDIDDLLPDDDWNGIHRGTPDKESAYPLIRMQMQAPADDLVTIGAHVYQYYYIGVIAVSQSSDEADDLSALIFDALNRQQYDIGNPNVHSVTSRFQSIWYQEGEGSTYTHSGGIYKIGVRVNG